MSPVPSLNTFIAPVTFSARIENVRAQGRSFEELSCGAAQLSPEHPTFNDCHMYQRLAPVMPKLVTIVGDDDAGQFSLQKRQPQFPGMLPLTTSGRTPFVITTPHPGGPSLGTLTYRSKVTWNIPDTLAQLQPLMPRHDGWLVLGVTSAHDAEFALAVLQRHTGRAYVTLPWCDDWLPENQSLAMQILRFPTALKQLTRQQLQRLTGETDVALGLCLLRGQGIDNIIITTETEGLYAIHDGQWQHAKSFSQAPRQHPPQATVPSIAGTLLASLERGETFQRSLELASAALASEAAGRPCLTWGELLAYHAEHHQVFTPETIVVTQDVSQRFTKAFRIAAATVTAGVLLISIWLAYSPFTMRA